MTYCAGDVLQWYGDPVLLLSNPDREGVAQATYLRITGDKNVTPLGLIFRLYGVSEKEPWDGDLDDAELALVTMIKMGIQPRIEGGFVRWP